MANSGYAARLLAAVAAVFGMVVLFGTFQDYSEAKRTDQRTSVGKKVAPSAKTTGKTVAPLSTSAGKKTDAGDKPAGKKVAPLATPSSSVLATPEKKSKFNPPTWLVTCQSRCATTRDICKQRCAEGGVSGCEVRCTNYYAGCVNRCTPKLSPR